MGQSATTTIHPRDLRAARLLARVRAASYLRSSPCRACAASARGSAARAPPPAASAPWPAPVTPADRYRRSSTAPIGVLADGVGYKSLSVSRQGVGRAPNRLMRYAAGVMDLLDATSRPNQGPGRGSLSLRCNPWKPARVCAIMGLDKGLTYYVWKHVHVHVHVFIQTAR